MSEFNEFNEPITGQVAARFRTIRNDGLREELSWLQGQFAECTDPARREEIARRVRTLQFLLKN